MTVITRFAPSPTGYLHIGGARTALFNYLFAKHHNGKFLLRIEDTDKARSTNEAKEAIFVGLKWLGLDWDDEVVLQSSREARHKEVALSLIKSGNAYYCFTPQDEIDNLRQEAVSNKQHFLFQSPWRDAKIEDYPKDIKPVVRLKAPREGDTIIRDKLQGDVIIENTHLDDMVLLRSDGSPTYMLAVVVDDHDMGITHIIRGDDHLTNAARQIALYQAFGWQVPEMVHIPLIHGMDGAKLSKRHGALGVEAYKEMGYLPEALCNYLLRLGWSHKDDEIISRQQAIEWFDIAGLGKSPARLDFAKMAHVNAHYLRNYNEEGLLNLVIEILQKSYQVTNEEKYYIKQALPSLKLRAELLTELAEIAKIYLTTIDLSYSEEAIKVIQDCNKQQINQVIELLRHLPSLEKDNIQEEFKRLAAENNQKIGEFMKPIRALITGATSSPSVFEIIAIIGVSNSVNRLSKAFG